MGLQLNNVIVICPNLKKLRVIAKLKIRNTSNLKHAKCRNAWQKKNSHRSTRRMRLRSPSSGTHLSKGVLKLRIRKNKIVSHVRRIVVISPTLLHKSYLPPSRGNSGRIPVSAIFNTDPAKKHGWVGYLVLYIARAALVDFISLKCIACLVSK